MARYMIPPELERPSYLDDNKELVVFVVYIDVEGSSISRAQEKMAHVKNIYDKTIRIMRDETGKSIHVFYMASKGKSGMECIYPVPPVISHDDSSDNTRENFRKKIEELAKREGKRKSRNSLDDIFPEDELEDIEDPEEEGETILDPRTAEFMRKITNNLKNNTRRYNG